MHRRSHTVVTLTLVLLALLAASCSLGPAMRGSQQEAQGTVEAVREHVLVVGDAEYRISIGTEFEGAAGLGEIAVGDEVVIGYREVDVRYIEGGSVRTARVVTRVSGGR